MKSKQETMTMTWKAHCTGDDHSLVVVVASEWASTGHVENETLIKRYQKVMVNNSLTLCAQHWAGRLEKGTSA